MNVILNSYPGVFPVMSFITFAITSFQNGRSLHINGTIYISLYLLGPFATSDRQVMGTDQFKQTYITTAI